MKSRKTKPTKYASEPAERSPARSFLRVEHLPDILLAGATAFLVATPLIPSEATRISAAQAPLNVLWLMLLLGWGAWLIQGTRSVRLGWTDGAMAGLVLWNVISGLVVGLEANGRQTLNMLWQWVAYGVIFFLLRQLIRTPRQQRAVVSVMLGLGVLLSAHGYYQYGYSLPKMRRDYQANPERMLTENRVPLDAASPDRQLFENRLMSKEPIATFALTNSLAGYLAPWTIVALGLGLAALTSQRRSLSQILVPLGIAVFLGGLLFLTKSRTAVLATLGGVVLLVLYGRQRGWQFDWKIPTAITAVAGLLGMVAVMTGGLDLPVLTEAPKSVLYRLEYWRSTAAMIADYPIFGCGPGCFQDYYARYKLPMASEMVADPHNFVLEIWATAGTPAVLLLIALMASVVVAHLRRGAAADSSLTSETPFDPATELHDETGNAGWIYGGAVLGVLLAYPLGFLVGYPPESTDFGLPVTWLVGLPAAAVAVALLRGWVRGGELPISLPIVGLIVLLANLLAAGAVGYPGVINSAWVLLALGLPRRSDWLVGISRQVALAILLVVLAILFAFLFTEYRPTLHSRGYMLAAESDALLGRNADVEQAYRRAADADPWSAESWRALADVRLQRWLALPNNKNWEEFRTAAESYVSANPQSHGHHSTLARWYLQAAAKAEELEDQKAGDAHLQSAAEALEQAVELYPNGAQNWAQLAWTLHLAGRTADAERAAENALRLDALHDHSEQKLSNLHLFDPLSPDKTELMLRPESAEQSLLKLRSSTGR